MDAILFDECEIVKHAHMIFRAVALVKIFQTVARKIITFKAKANEAFSHQITMRSHMNTMLAARQTTWTILLIKSLFI